jgi:hypothetical protein
MLAVPAATAVTTPVALFTVATAVFELDQVCARPVSTVPSDARIVAVAWAVDPIAMVVGLRATVTVATG